jgi:hypothetical protein
LVWATGAWLSAPSLWVFRKTNKQKTMLGLEIQKGWLAFISWTWWYGLLLSSGHQKAQS